MKAEIRQGGIGTYEVWVKNFWFSPWNPVKASGLPLAWRGSKARAIKLRDKINSQR